MDGADLADCTGLAGDEGSTAAETGTENGAKAPAGQPER
jgi:hypothetical protein